MNTNPFHGGKLPRTAQLVADTGLEDTSKRAVAMRKYRDTVDFVLCAMYPDLEGACRAFYAGTGPQLRELVKEAKLIRLDVNLMKDMSTTFKGKDVCNTDPVLSGQRAHSTDTTWTSAVTRMEHLRPHNPYVHDSVMKALVEMDKSSQSAPGSSRLTPC